MIKIAHESPIDLFSYVQTKTDYDYCLVHLLEESEAYKEAFVKACKERDPSEYAVQPIPIYSFIIKLNQK
jgi:hypothetical protein